MIRNDYRRAMIMLRALEGDTSGFVRLERRTLRGTLQFTVNGAPTGELRAAMLGSIHGAWRIHDLGALRRDARGQAGMTFTYDPRNIAGFDLDDYTMLGVIGQVGNQWRLTMSGWVSGSKVVDWAAAGAAVDAQYSPGGAQKAQAERAPMAEMEVSNAGDSPSFDVAETEAYAEAFAPEPAMSEPVTALPDAAEMTEASVSSAPAAESLALPLEMAWPAELATLRDLFMTQPPYEGLAIEDYVFVRAPMPSVSEQEFCAVGIMTQDGMIARTCYAIPGQYAAQPPAGLEGYVFMQGEDGSGWWVVCHDAA